MLTNVNEQMEMAFPTIQPAVLVRNIHVSFGKNVVLKHFNMTVSAGSIYGLLGPSGCGKTSLIRTILGMNEIKCGSIKVYGGPAMPGPDVGYMPQDYTLFDEMTVKEILSYFGTLYALTAVYIRNRTSFLLNLLNLTDKLNKRISTLSGGQKRRVSLAIAMIHNPRLLLLDEPSVGLDPPLRQSIWNYLTQLCQTNSRTVLISTHYIEETRTVDRIGLIRHGSMLIEGNPTTLLDRYRLNSLEALFLRLCQDYDVNQNVTENSASVHESIARMSVSDLSTIIEDTEATFYRPPIPEILPSVSSSMASLTRSSAMVRKNLLFLIRNPAYLMFQFFLPTAELFLFSICIGLRLYNIPVAVYNGDHDSIFTTNMLNSVNKETLHMIPYASEDLAIDSVRLGEAQAALVISPNFTDALRERVLMLGEIDNATLYTSTIRIFPDHSNPIMCVTIFQTMVESFTSVGKQYLSSMNMSPLLLELPLQFSTPIFGSTDSTMNDFMIPGVVFSIAFLAAIPLTALSLVTERRSGLIERTLSTGVSHCSFIISLIVAQFLVLLMQVILLMFVIYYLIGFDFHGQMFLIGLLTVLQSFCGMSFGLLVSSLSNSETFATMLALGSFYPNLLISGAVWPIEGANYYVRKICYIFPQTYPIEAVRAMFTRGWGFDQTLVQLGFGVTMLWTVVFILLAIVSLKYLKR